MHNCSGLRLHTITRLLIIFYFPNLLNTCSNAPSGRYQLATYFSSQGMSRSWTEWTVGFKAGSPAAKPSIPNRQLWLMLSALWIYLVGIIMLWISLATNATLKSFQMPQRKYGNFTMFPPPGKIPALWLRCCRKSFKYYDVMETT